MFKWRDLLIFLAGAEFFHTLSHILVPYFFHLPLDLGIMVLTTRMNITIIVVNALITLALLWWAKRLH